MRQVIGGWGGVYGSQGSLIEQEISGVRNSDDCFSWGFGADNVVTVRDDLGAILATGSFEDWGGQAVLQGSTKTSLEQAFNSDGVFVCIWYLNIKFKTSAQEFDIDILATPDGWQHPVWGYPEKTCDASSPTACYSGFHARFTAQELDDRQWFVQLCDEPSGAAADFQCVADVLRD